MDKIVLENILSGNDRTRRQAMAIVGKWQSGEFIPDNTPNQRPPAPNDVIQREGEFYRLYDGGRGDGQLREWCVTAEIAASAFFSEIIPLELEV